MQDGDTITVLGKDATSGEASINAGTELGKFWIQTAWNMVK